MLLAGTDIILGNKKMLKKLKSKIWKEEDS
jgi:hypothetical protein